MKTITEENATTKSEISSLIYAHRIDDFNPFTALVERMLDKYAEANKNIIIPFDMINKMYQQQEEMEKKEVKITPETKISEFTPEGYEFSHISEKKIEYADLTYVPVYIKKKSEKNFEWYVNRYSLKKQYGFNTINNSDHLQSFEYKIGLLKLICDDLKIQFPLNLSTNMHYLLDSQLAQLKSICPEEFINSIIK
jgi:hypothetical protein